jgi:hypothetical protein
LYNLDEFNDELYDQQKQKYTEAFRNILKNVDGNSPEDMDAFFNALEDFYFDPE